MLQIPWRFVNQRIRYSFKIPHRIISFCTLWFSRYATYSTWRRYLLDKQFPFILCNGKITISPILWACSLREKLLYWYNNSHITIYCYEFRIACIQEKGSGCFMSTSCISESVSTQVLVKYALLNFAPLFMFIS